MLNCCETPLAEPRPRTSLALVCRAGKGLPLALLAACGDDGGSGPASTFEPGSPALLSVNSPTKDEDPSVILARDGTIFVAWFSDRGGNADIYIASTRNGRDWTPARRITTNVDGDFYPTLLITLVWVRHDTRQSLPWLNPKSDLFYSTSPDGRSWASPTKITTEAGDIVHLFPGLYATLDRQWSLVWLSTRLGSPKAFEVSLGGLRQYPAGLVENAWLRPGYSHLIAPTPTPGIYLGVWVEGPDGAQDIYYRVFSQ